MSGPTRQQALGLLGAGSAVVFTAAWLIASAAEPGYLVARDDLSALAAVTAIHPWIMIGGDLTLALGIVALAWALSTAVRGMAVGGVDAKVAVGLLATAAAAIAVQAFAREDCNTATADCIAREQAGGVTWQHHVHGPASALAFLAVLGAPLVLARPLREQSHQRRLAAYSIATAAGGSIALLAMMLTPQPYGGLAQRLFISIPVAWILILGLRLAQRTVTWHPHVDLLPVTSLADRPKEPR